MFLFFFLSLSRQFFGTSLFVLYLFFIALPISLLDWSFHHKTPTIYLPIFHHHHNNNKILNDHTFNSIQQTKINKCRVHPARLDHIPVPARPLCLVRKVSCVFDDDDDEAGAAVEAINQGHSRITKTEFTDDDIFCICFFSLSLIFSSKCKRATHIHTQRFFKFRRRRHVHHDEVSAGWSHARSTARFKSFSFIPPS